MEGVEIKYQDIKYTEEDVNFKQRIAELLQKADSEQPKQEIAKIIEIEERKRLINKIREIVLLKAKQRFNIQASEAEINQHWHEMTKDVNFEKELSSMHKKIKLLLEALKAVYERGQNQNSVYFDLLKESMSLVEWETHLKYYSTPARRKSLEQQLNLSVDEFSKPDIGARLFVESQKLDDYIAREIEKEKIVYQKKIEKMILQSKGNLSTINRKALARELWIQEECKKSNIEIKDQRFADVIPMLFSQ